VLLDRYEPGRCNWWFSGVAIRVGKGTTSTWTGTIMTAADERKERICGGYSPNGGPEPVTLRCKFTPSLTRPSSNQPECGGRYSPLFFGKEYQRLMFGARTVEVRVIDVDDERD
jgi:hypothetical protein